MIASAAECTPDRRGSTRHRAWKGFHSRIVLVWDSVSRALDFSAESNYFVSGFVTGAGDGTVGADGGSAFCASASRLRNSESTIAGMLFSGLQPSRSTVR